MESLWPHSHLSHSRVRPFLDRDGTRTMPGSHPPRRRNQQLKLNEAKRNMKDAPPRAHNIRFYDPTTTSTAATLVAILRPTMMVPPTETHVHFRVATNSDPCLSVESTRSLRRDSSLQNLLHHMKDTMHMHISPHCIRSHIVSVATIDDQTKAVAIEIPKEYEVKFQTDHFVALCHPHRLHETEAGTFPIVSVVQCDDVASGGTALIVDARVDETEDPHSLTTFLYRNGHAGMPVNVVL